MISFRTPNQPLPMESNPRKVFFTMFGQGDTKEERVSILKTTDSLLDYVRESTASLNKKLDAADRARVERLPGFGARDRTPRAEARRECAVMVDLPDAPLGPPEDFGELLDVQFEMLALAWQTNRTKVASMKMVEEASMRTYPNLGVHEAFHPTSHWGGFPERVANLRLIQNYHTAVFAKFVQRLKDMREGDGSVLDHSIILFGSNMANSDAHNNDPLPQALIGRGGDLKGNQHLHYSRTRPHANILVTMLRPRGCAGEEIEKFADTTGAFVGSMRTIVAAAALALAVASPWYAQSGDVRPKPDTTAAPPARPVASGFSRTTQKGRTPKKDDVNRRNVDGSTPLQWAVYNGDVAEATAARCVPARTSRSPTTTARRR